MIERKVKIGGRHFPVVVEESQVEELDRAVSRLDEIAQSVVNGNPHVDSQYLLLMSGIILANSFEERAENNRGSIIRIRELENELAMRNSNLRDANAKLAQLNAQGELSQTESEVERLSAEVTALEEERDALLRENAALKASSEEVAVLNAQLEELRAQIAQNQKEREALSLAIARLETFIE